MVWENPDAEKQDGDVQGYVIPYFDMTFANDTTHEFLLRNQGGIQQEGFIDTLAMNVNQNYIYYIMYAR